MEKGKKSCHEDRLLMRDGGSSVPTKTPTASPNADPTPKGTASSPNQVPSTTKCGFMNMLARFRRFRWFQRFQKVPEEGSRSSQNPDTEAQVLDDTYHQLRATTSTSTPVIRESIEESATSLVTSLSFTSSDLSSSDQLSEEEIFSANRFPDEFEEETLDEEPAPVSLVQEPMPKVRDRLIYHIKLGTGTFGSVWKAKHQPSGKYVAVKIVKKTRKGARHRYLRREAIVLASLHHPNIIKLFEYYEDSNRILLVMELAEGNLWDLIDQYTFLSEPIVRVIMRQATSALEYLHRHRIMHRDIKPDNLLLNRNLQLKFADFGTARAFKTGCKYSTVRGAFSFLAPEVLNNEDYRGPELDVWSFGVSFHTMLSGTMPFTGATMSKVRKCINRGYVIPGHLSVQCKKLLKAMLTINPKKRITAREMLRHPWINEGSATPLMPYKETEVKLKNYKGALERSFGTFYCFSPVQGSCLNVSS